MKLQVKKESLTRNGTDEFFSHLFGTLDGTTNKTENINSVEDFFKFLNKWFIHEEVESKNPDFRWTTQYIFDERWFHLDDYSNRQSIFNFELISVIDKCLSYCGIEGTTPDWWKQGLRTSIQIRYGIDSFLKTIYSISKVKHPLAFHASLNWLRNYNCSFSIKELVEHQLSLKNLEEEPTALYAVNSGKTIGNVLDSIAFDELKAVSSFFLNKDIKVMVWKNNYIKLHGSRPKSILPLKDPSGELSKSVIRSPRCYFLALEGNHKTVTNNNKWRPGFTYKLIIAAIVASYRETGVEISKKEIENAKGQLPVVSKDLSQLKSELKIVTPLLSKENGERRILNSEFQIAILSY